jgi:hypothetical protein
MISLKERIQCWIHSKAPRVLDVLQMFTVIEWVIILIGVGYVGMYCIG